MTAVGQLKRVDSVRRLILLMDGAEISIEDVLDIQCEALGFGGADIVACPAT